MANGIPFMMKMNKSSSMESASGKRMQRTGLSRVIMSLTFRFSREILRSSHLVATVGVLAVLGTTLEIFGFMWDASGHMLQEPETFWSIQHITAYSGVALLVTSAIIGTVLLITKLVEIRIARGIKMIIIGAALQIAAGTSDFFSHLLLGADGLVSIPHLVLEAGPVLGAFGGFLLLSQMKDSRIRRLIPVAIVTTIFSLASILFNISMVLSGEILCIPVYEIFSHGCAIL